MNWIFTQSVRKGRVPASLFMKPLALLMMGLLMNFQVAAQSNTNLVIGKITDENGEGLPGVSVIVRGTSIGTVTDIEGKYSLNARNDQTLVFSFVGYLKEEIAVQNQSDISLSLVQDVKSLEEVVVIGYGSMQRNNVTGAITSVSAKEIEKAPLPDVMESLRGQVSGLQVTRSGGQPGSGVSFTLRGLNSLTASNQPLIVIDGVPMSGGNLTDINPADIKSIDILKDASAAAIFGSSSANGVVLITTKDGERGKTSVTVDASVGFNHLSMPPPMFDADGYVKMKRDAARQAGMPTGINSILDDPVERNNYIAGREVDWHDQMMRTGLVRETGVTLSGGTDKLRLYMNANAYNETGVILNSDFNRYSVRLNSDYKPNERLTVGARVQLTATHSDETGNTLDHNNDADFGMFVGNTPLGRTHDEFGNLVPTVRGDQFQFNPQFRYAESDANRQTSRVYINPYLKFEITKGLTYTLNSYAEQRSVKFNRFTSTLFNDGAQNMARIEVGGNTTYLLDNILNYTTSLGAYGSIDATLIYGFQTFNGYTLNTQSRDQPNDLLGYEGIGNTSSEMSTINNYLGAWGREYVAGRLGYSYKDRYNATVTVRRDGSSRFGDNYKYGVFPSGAIAWNIHEENFLKNSSINQLKLRTSYGLMGNDNIMVNGNPDDFARMALAQSVVYGDSRGLHSGFTTGNRAPNADLRWETSNQFNIGFDFGILKNRITATVDYFNTKTKDLLLMEQLPITSGYTQVLSNVGRTENWGVDAQINAQIITGNFTWQTIVNYGMNRNKIISLNRNNVDEDGNPVHDYANNWFIGERIGTIFTWDYEGVYQLGEEDIAQSMHPTLPNYGAGMPKLRDVNGDGVIDADDRTFVGNTSPDHYGGINNVFGYKGFELSILLDFVQGVQRSNWYYGNLTGRTNSFAVDYWTPDNPTNYYPSPHATDGIPFMDAVRVRDASFIALRNISLTYNLPKHVISKTPLQNVSLFVRGNNLHYWTNYLSYSPEVDAFQFPISRTWRFGTRITL